ncbi:MAG: hypothetical protein E7646_06140 [Ruminococcaceae bacterium]|nr:hypothetical protein [Oscillospiraceae bacterium]
MKRIIALLLIFLTVFACSCATAEDDSEVTEAEIEALVKIFEEKLSSGELEAEFSGDHRTEAMKLAFGRFLADRPEIFWFNGGFSCERSGFGEGTKIVFKPYSSGDTESNLKKQAELFEALNKLCEEADKLEGDFEKIKYLYDQIAINTAYDGYTAYNIELGEDPKAVYSASGSYGCLIEKKAVCSGYSAVFQLAARKLGYEVNRISGIANQQYHQWNQICVDGQWYNIDVTWGDVEDPETRAIIGDVGYGYFMCTDAEFKQHHIADEDQKPEKCDSERFDYYRNIGAYVEKYDYETVAAIIRAQLDSNGERAEVKFSSTEECQKALDELITAEKIFEVHPAYSVGAVHYTTGGEKVLGIAAMDASDLGD